MRCESYFNTPIVDLKKFGDCCCRNANRRKVGYWFFKPCGVRLRKAGQKAAELTRLHNPNKGVSFRD